MRGHVWRFGIVLGAAVAVLHWIEYRWLIVDYSVELYGALIAALFAVLGLWLGRKLTRPAPPVIIRESVPVPVEVPVEVPVPAPATFVRDDARVAAIGLTPRELEILALIAEGLSTRGMAERLGVSENTVKTHTSRVLDKLGAERRTQAVQFGKEWRLIP